ncbi:MAG: hypothetical protein N2321_06860 [Melioribacteraceae bacterium]|nr:hypothetical protein [Melioribacteraceae bacterium]
MILLFGCRENDIIISEDFSVPQIPMGFKIYGAFDGQIGLEWIPNNSSDSYLIYRSVNDTLNFTLIKITNDKFFVDTNLEYNLLYFYKIKARSRNNNESGFTKIVSAKPINLYAPTRPIINSISSLNKIGNLSITIKWTQLIDTDISYYEIFRDTTELFYNMDEPYSKVNTTIFEDKLNLKPLKNYFYRIKAVDKGGLKSQATSTVNTKILDLPKQTFPLNNTIINKLNEYKFITSSENANYKIYLYENDTDLLINEISINSNKVKEEISVPMNINLIAGRKYKWRILAFMQNSNEPNCLTDYYNFTIAP